MNLSLVVTAALTGGHCGGHEIVPDVVVVVVVVCCWLLGLARHLVGGRLEKFCFEAQG